MFAVIQRTHRAGAPVERHALEKPTPGTIKLCMRYDAAAGRHLLHLVFMPLPSQNKGRDADELHRLDQPSPRMFDEEQGMTVHGYETVDGAQHHQEWLIEWFPEMPLWYQALITPF